MTRRLWRALLMVIGTVSVGCSDTATITAPATVSPTPQSIAVAGLPSEFPVGEVVQLTARLRWSDDRTEDVTARTRWTSSTTACLVSASGFATAIEPGPCSITASVAPVSTMATAAVTPSRVFSLSGVVREQYALREPPIPGATVTIVSGPRTGQTVTVDDTGQFSLPGLPVPSVMLRVQATGFEPKTVTATNDTLTLDVFLAPETGTISWTYQTADPLVTPFHVRHRGPYALTVSSVLDECGTYEHFVAQICSTDTGSCVTGATPCPPSRLMSVTGYLDPGNYVLRILLRAPGSGGKTAELTHPR